MNCSRSRDGERSLSGAFQMGGFPVVLWHPAGQNFALGFWGRGFLIFRAKRWERSLSVSALDLVACSHSPLNALSSNWRRWCRCAVTDEEADCADDSQLRHGQEQGGYTFLNIALFVSAARTLPVTKENFRFELIWKKRIKQTVCVVEHTLSSLCVHKSAPEKSNKPLLSPLFMIRYAVGVAKSCRCRLYR